MAKRIIAACIILLLVLVVRVAAEDCRYIGTWQREATYTDGQLMHNEPATMKLDSLSFESFTETYSVSGNIEVNGNSMKMVAKVTNIPGYSVGTSTNHTYAISADGNTMTLTNTEYGAEVKEIYERSK